MNTLLKKVISIILLSAIVITITLYFIKPQYFTAENLKFFFEKFDGIMLPVYIAVFIVRGFTLIPSLPFVVVGMLLFPHNPFLVLVISMFCICLSATNIYYFSDYLGFSKVLNKKYDLIKYNSLIEKYGFWFVLGWSFFPFVPTDAVCYACGIVKMQFSKFILALFIGELFIVSFLIYYENIILFVKSLN